MLIDQNSASSGSDFAPCVVIPCYNHGATMAAVLLRLSPFALPVFIVDDGSDDSTRQQLEMLASERVTLIRLPHNQGKGVAVIHGLQAASAAGFSHAVQLDADGQHHIEDCDRLLQEARRYPDSLVSGQPVYDDSIPKSRLYGRYVTHFWVWIETLSFSLKDSMCGFRVYPLGPTLALVKAHPIGQRMDFDTDIMVRLYWRGTPSRFVPTRVTYPADGLSHFDAVADNLRISRMHTRLFFGMLWRIPALLKRRSHRHWTEGKGAERAAGIETDAGGLATGWPTPFYPVAMAGRGFLLAERGETACGLTTMAGSGTAACPSAAAHAAAGPLHQLSSFFAFRRVDAG